MDSSYQFPRRTLTRIAAWCRRPAKSGASTKHSNFASVGDGLNVKMGLPFPRGIKIKPGETVVFSWIVYKSRDHHDRVNAKVMKDPRIAQMPKTMPFDVKGMMYGGFKTIVGA
jgi:uncharacterized protein YbaA (DUF1428 family)